MRDQEDLRQLSSPTSQPKEGVEGLHPFSKGMLILTNSSIKERWTEKNLSLEQVTQLSLVLTQPEAQITSTERVEEEPIKEASSTPEWLDQPDMPLETELNLRKAQKLKCFKLSKRKRAQEPRTRLSSNTTFKIF